MGVINDFLRMFTSGNGNQEDRPGMIKLIIYIVLVLAALYYIQKWTGIPVYDWVGYVGDWLEYIFSKILKIIVDLLPNS